MLWAASSSGPALRALYDNHRTYFTTYDRKVISVIKPGEWELVAKALRQELRCERGLTYDPAMVPWDREPRRLYHPIRRLYAPAHVMSALKRKR
jgi:hypothetical protein